MRGYVEESPEQKAAAALKHAARTFSAQYLMDPFDTATEEAALQAAAEAWTAAVWPSRKRSPRAKDPR